MCVRLNSWCLSAAVAFVFVLLCYYVCFLIFVFSILSTLIVVLLISRLFNFICFFLLFTCSKKKPLRLRRGSSAGNAETDSSSGSSSRKRKTKSFQRSCKCILVVASAASKQAWLRSYPKCIIDNNNNNRRRNINICCIHEPRRSKCCSRVIDTVTILSYGHDRLLLTTYAPRERNKDKGKE